MRAHFSALVGFRQARVKALPAEVPAGAWHRLDRGTGSKRPRLYDWAVTPTNCPEPGA